MPKYRICCTIPAIEDSIVSNCKPKTQYFDVHGWPMTVPELDGIRLFIHHPLNSGDGWNISEFRTGETLIQYVHGTRKQTLDALRAKLANSGIPNIKQFVTNLIEKQITEFGVANDDT